MRHVQIDSFQPDDMVMQTVPDGPLLFEIPADLCLQREIRLPAEAARKAAQVADFDLRQSLPLQGRGLVWRLGKPELRGKHLYIQAFILKTSQLEAIQRHFLGRVARIELRGAPGTAPFIDNRKVYLRGVGTWSVLALAAPIAIICIGLWPQWVKLKETRAQVSIEAAELQELTTQTVALRDAATRRTNDTARIEAEQALLQIGRGRVWLLAELTQKLNDDTWVSAFVLNGEELRLTGYTKGSVANLIAALQSEDWVVSARLDGPLMRDNFLNASRFDLLLTLKQVSTTQ
ncbi:MAG: PilN domain-containing protein [Paracoccaceae bacterium]